MSQAESLVTVQAQPLRVVRTNAPLPPSFGTVVVAGEIAYVHVVPAWVTDTDWPATVAVPVLEDADVLAATVNVVDPLPLPSVAGGTLIHETLEDTDQLQPADVVTVTAASPPEPPIESVMGDTE
jgi:hypothetical protein